MREMGQDVATPITVAYYILYVQMHDCAPSCIEKAEAIQYLHKDQLEICVQVSPRDT